MKQIEFEIVLRKTSMIIIDSLASIVRREFSGTDSNVLYERSIFLSKTSSRLKIIAEVLDTSVMFLTFFVFGTDHQLIEILLKKKRLLFPIK